MTQEQIIQWARKAGLNIPDRRNDLWMPQLERFANLVAADTKEKCAKVCESLFDADDNSCNEAEVCAAAIRNTK